MLDIATGPASGVVITEQPEADVPTLVADNPTERLVLLVAGETVLGGLQNRVLNVSVLLPANGRVLVPVSCVEQGRWNRGGAFSSGRSLAPRRVRRANVSTVADSVRLHNAKVADQFLVWDVVGAELSRHDAFSPSMALAAVDERFDADRAWSMRCGRRSGDTAGDCRLHRPRPLQRSQRPTRPPVRR